jgi:hypothetical protein
VLRCAWCHSSAGILRPLLLHDGREQLLLHVHAEHESSVVAWHESVIRRRPAVATRLALVPLLLLSAIGVAAAINASLILPAAGVAMLSIAAIFRRFPIATPQTLALVGVRMSMALVRGLALGIGVLGALITAVGIWLFVHVA